MSDEQPTHTSNHTGSSESREPSGGSNSTGKSDAPKEIKDAMFGRIVGGKYEILQKLGGGGMGTVYRAKHSEIDRIVAIKLIHRQLIEDDDTEFLDRFRREAKAASKIEHPNAVPVYDYGVEDNVPYLVMRYVDGRSLRDVVENGERFLPERVVALSEQLCDVLQLAHTLGIVHRDLKPDNILLVSRPDGSEWVQVLDFGLAKMLGSDNESMAHITRTGRIIGTPRYMSPEQARDKEVDHRSDIYSLGVVIYELLAGRPPFLSNSFTDLLLKHVSEAPPALSEIAPERGVPDPIESVVMQMLQKDPAARPRSMTEVAARLRNAWEVSRSSAAPVPKISKPPSRRKMPTISTTHVVSAVCLLAVVAGIGVASTFDTTARLPASALLKREEALRVSLPKGNPPPSVSMEPPTLPLASAVPVSDPSIPLVAVLANSNPASVPVPPNSIQKTFSVERTVSGTGKSELITHRGVPETPEERTARVAALGLGDSERGRREPEHTERPGTEEPGSHSEPTTGEASTLVVGQICGEGREGPLAEDFTRQLAGAVRSAYRAGRIRMDSHRICSPRDIAAGTEAGVNDFVLSGEIRANSPGRLSVRLFLTRPTDGSRGGVSKEYALSGEQLHRDGPQKVLGELCDKFTRDIRTYLSRHEWNS